ncbi:5-formyltetrahydrofolate cyclo-ligase [Phaffia rhodozyma]|uniref:5-formyltetrahydrofolate cyclo-ligase n=1 Tax=Phaffia rhodozyma TaxID=264483 RepID=A0A0F7SU04_PHARH|nr:5-formyltetrahydrofolate cyclo-ligase [Phaffia rhodozyma]
MSTSSLPSVKRALRKQIQTILRSIPPEGILAQLYLPTVHSEIQTFELIKHALDAGKSVYVPFIPAGSNTDMQMLRLYEEDVPMTEDGSTDSGLKGDGWNRDKWGIPVLPLTRKDTGLEREDASTSAHYLDLILLPGVAFSPTASSLFSRLGHGKGYYDKYITQYRSICAGKNRPGPKLIGLALKEQFLDKNMVPIGEWDANLDEVLVGDHVRTLSEDN